MRTPTANNSALHARLRPLLVAAFFQGFVLWYAIEKLFMHAIGISNAQVALLTVLSTAAMLVANVPLGILADRWSRRGVLLLASGALMASSLVGGASHALWQYAVSGLWWALFYACYYGTYDSIVYDVLLEELGESEQFEHYYGRVQLADSVALVGGSLLSALVAHFWGLRAAYFLTVPFTAASIAVLLAFREPTLHRKSVAVQDSRIRVVGRLIVQKGIVLRAAICLVLVGATMRFMFELDQLWLVALALPAAWYGPVNALLLGTIGAAGPVASRIKRKPAAIGLVGVAMLGASASLLTHLRLLIIVSQIVMILALIVLEILFSRHLHDALPSNVRAAASSAVTTVGWILFLPLGLLFSAVSARTSVFRAAWVVVGLTAAVCIALLSAIRAARSESN